MTDRHLYKHSVTGEVNSFSEGFANVFGDRLIRVDSEGGSTDSTKKRSSRKSNASADADTDTNSSKEGTS